MKNRIIPVLWAILFFICLSCCIKRTNESLKPIAILGAFSDEIKMLEDSLTEARIVETGGIHFIQGKLRGKEVVIAFTGIGKVNASMTTTLVIDHFKPSKVIFTGIAGGLNPELKPTDILVAEKCVQHDLNYVYDDSLVSYPVSSPITDKVNPLFYTSDSLMLGIVKEKFPGIKLASYTIGDDMYQPKIMTGIIATGDGFIASGIKKEELISRFGADAVEMEGAAVAQVCYQQNVPFILIRSISDSADENANMDVDKFLHVAAENANRVVIALLEGL